MRLRSRCQSKVGPATASRSRFSFGFMSQAAAAIPQKLFFKIGEVCELAGVQAHVLRYWETEFPMLTPQKNRAGQRTYRRRDVEMALRIKELLYEEQYTIAGAKKKLAGELRSPNREKPANDPETTPRVSSLPRSGRSLTPPPSLRDARMKSPEEQPNAENQNGLGQQERAALREIAAQLREILDVLDSGDVELR